VGVGLGELKPVGDCDGWGCHFSRRIQHWLEFSEDPLNIVGCDSHSGKVQHRLELPKYTLNLVSRELISHLGHHGDHVPEECIGLARFLGLGVVTPQIGHSSLSRGYGHI